MGTKISLLLSCRRREMCDTGLKMSTFCQFEFRRSAASEVGDQGNATQHHPSKTLQCQTRTCNLQTTARWDFNNMFRLFLIVKWSCQAVIVL